MFHNIAVCFEVTVLQSKRLCVKVLDLATGCIHYVSTCGHQEEYFENDNVINGSDVVLCTKVSSCS